MRTWLRSKATLLFLTCAVLLAGTAIAAIAAELVTAEVDADTNATAVEVEQGKSANFNIQLSATGNLAAATETNPSTAAVHTSYSITRNPDATISKTSGTFSSSKIFWGNSSGDATWTGAPTPYSVPASVSVGSNVPVGNYTYTLSTSAGTTQVTNPSGAGGKLADSTATTITVHVVAPDDSTAPTNASIDIDDGATWTNNAGGNVSVDLSATDNVGVVSYKLAETQSGLGSATAQSVSPTTNFSLSNVSFTLTGSEASSKAVWLRVTDAQGNFTDASDTIGWDKTAPGYSCPTADSDWHATNQTFNCTASDGGSGLTPASDSSFSLSTTVAAGSEDNNASTGTKTLTDVAGNTVTAPAITGVKVDRKAPSFSCPTADSDWHATNQTFNCTASDGGSGLTPTGDSSFSLSTTVAAGNETSNAATGTKGLSDAVGNTATAGPITGVKVDRKAPSITITTPAATTYSLGQSVNANYGCSDLGSGLLTCLGTVNNGSAIDTSTIGSHSFKVDAEDNVNNKNSVSVNYSVAAAFNGFLQPIDGNMVNSGKVGRVYPVKWQLKDANQNLISDTAAQALIDQNVIQVQQRSGNTACSDYPSDSLETEVAAGSTVVRYDASSDQFVYNYKAPATKGCYKLDVIKADGVNTQSILFNFTK